jgi:hypothetical protein
MRQKVKNSIRLKSQIELGELLEQPFTADVPLDPRVPQKVARGSTRNCEIYI